MPSRRNVELPTLDEYDAEIHPAWGLIGASRVSSSPPGHVLFDSDLQHQHFVVVTVKAARRRRDLHRDWLSGGKEYIEVAMSEAQWASFVSSMNTGDGVPCTVEHVGMESMPGFPYEPRLGETMDEVRQKSKEAIKEVSDAFAAYQEKKNAANLRNLEFAIRNLPSNMHFAATSLSEHSENVVQKARADIEAMVVNKAQQLGIDSGELGIQHQIGSGE